MEVERKRAALAGAEATLRESRAMVGEAFANTARAKSAKEEAKKLASQALPLKLVCSQPSSDWSEEVCEGARERKKEMLVATWRRTWRR